MLYMHVLLSTTIVKHVELSLLKIETSGKVPYKGQKITLQILAKQTKKYALQISSTVWKKQEFTHI